MVNDLERSLDEVFHALSSHTRRSILQRLSKVDCTVGELAGPHSMSTAGISKHIDVLERAGLVARSRQGRTTVCHLNAAALEEATRLLDYYRSFWSDQLDALERYLKEKSGGRDEPR
jgi:DNA-binding transcriptional ArsR family regulator